MQIISANGYLKTETTRFPGGEINFKLINPDQVWKRAIIRSRITKSFELIEILLAKDALERNNKKG